MKHCKFCNHQLRDDAKFCPQCGRSITQDYAKPRKSMHKNSRVKGLLTLLGCILISGGLLAGLCAALVHFNVIDIHFVGNESSTTPPELNYTFPDYLEDTYRKPAETVPMIPSEDPLPSTEPVNDQQFYENPILSAGNYHSVYLRQDGTVAAKGSSQASAYANRGYRCDVSGWTDIIQVSAASQTVGVKSDGTVVAVGVNRYGQCDLDSWRDIVAVSAGDNSTLGLRSDGTVVAKGDNHLGQCDVSDWKDIVQVAAGAETSYGLQSNGTVRAVGGNRSGQREVYAWSDIKAISAGIYHVAGLKKDGTVITAGISEEWEDDYSTWTDIVAISASSTHLVGLRADGTVVSCGRNDYGELNTGSWSDIVAISAGMHFTLGMKSDGSLVAVGSNAFGQLDIVDYTDEISGENVAFVSPTAESESPKGKKLSYPISEGDCYIIYKNYFGYEMKADESIEVVVDHFGEDDEEALAFCIYHRNPNTGDYIIAGTFFVNINTGVCERDDIVFQADDYYY